MSLKSVERFFIKNKVNYLVIEKNDKVDLDKYDYLIKSPSISLYDSIIIECKKKKIKVISDLELFYLLYPNNYYVIVTGTNGKTSVINNLHNLLLFNNLEHYYIGNMGNPIFDVAGEVLYNKIILIECSSYMLETTNNFKPNIYTITNLSTHHIEHHKSKRLYYRSKLMIIKRMDKGILINPSNNIYVNNIRNKKVYNVRFKSVLNDNHLILDKYKFNLENISKFSKFDITNLITSFIMFYYIYMEYKLNIDLYQTFEYLDKIKKYPFRFEKIVDNNDLVVINDSKSTNIDSGIKALIEMNEKYSNFYLIIGGKYLNQKFGKVKKYLNNVKCLYLYGENKNIIYNKLKSKVNIIMCNNLEEIIDDIFLYNNDKKIILFSPMSTSFDQFKSFEQRGEYFNQLINKKIL